VTFERTLELLRIALKGPLPGATAHEMLAPRPRADWPAGFKHEDLRHAAGLLLVFPKGDSAHIVLTERAHSLGRHRGQVSMPGGVLEPGESIEQAALREAHEEIGLDTAVVQTFGALTPIDIPVSGFRLHPVVAAMDRTPTLRAAHGEVARILETPVEALLNPRMLGSRSVVRDGRSIDIPAFLTGGVEIWGATAMVLAEFLVLLGWPGPSDERAG
jgi:8-oxo-dGTP pyrophosphatase MutT (NUDIX family)